MRRGNPPEEVLIARHARTLEDASYVAHRMIKSASELVAMGYDYDEIEEYIGYDGSSLDPEAFEEIEARNPFDNMIYPDPVSYTHLTLPTKRIV